METDNNVETASELFKAQTHIYKHAFGYANSMALNCAIQLGMASESQMMRLVVEDCREVFEGLNSLVDVGGGTGIIAKTILEAFPQLKCTVLDLPHVVANMPQSENLSYVGGDMFQSIPHADVILLKMLKRCREAIRDENEGRKAKVLIIDMVLNRNEEEEEADMTEVKLNFDVMMMVLLTGRERTEKEWEKLFLEAGFMTYKISPVFGLSSLIEVFP
ncbi:hypothetical protein K7X08_018065 [Anisodus acutangulus]|uniref:O-methyltransferase C-terminal domain-containing protein n=1 Tax=Anisodus acutangulus TaxID=402998 RepID=A0A9Q1LYI2_9SOLA|nr:hypothetical protein K7X08_018065 [Anisodus acutangulus]